MENNNKKFITLPDTAWIIIASGVSMLLVEIGIGLISWFN